MQQCVGEHFVLGFRGTSLPDWVKDFETEFALGGLILFDGDLAQPGRVRNVESPEQVGSLCRDIHRLPTRPLVFVDQEGGRVRRFKPERGFRDLPSAHAFARLDEAEARRVALESFVEMKELGVDFDLAPVIDLNTNPGNPNIGAIERSFSSEPEEVRRCAAILAEAARRTRLGLCLKHYPGLGGARTDSHLALTDLTGTVSEAQLALFDDLCDEIPGSAILLSHGLVRDWDPDWPVSVSEIAIARLRSSAPEALLVTDDLQMDGLQQFCSTLEASVRALRAGADLLCIGNNLLDQESICFEAARAVEEAAARDAGLRARLRESRRRVALRKGQLAPLD